MPTAHVTCKIRGKTAGKMASGNCFAVMRWTNDGDRLSVHNLKRVIEPKKRQQEFCEGDAGLAVYPGYPGQWAFLIFAVGAERKEMEIWLKNHLREIEDHREAEVAVEKVKTSKKKDKDLQQDASTAIVGELLKKARAYKRTSDSNSSGETTPNKQRLHSSPTKKARPTKHTATPTKPKTTPTKSSLTSTKSLTTPTKFRITPVKSRTSPAKFRMTPAKTSMTPAKSRTTPAKSRMTPVKSSGTPTKSNETPTKSRIIPVKHMLTPVEAKETLGTNLFVTREELDAILESFVRKSEHRRLRKKVEALTAEPSSTGEEAELEKVISIQKCPFEAVEAGLKHLFTTDEIKSHSATGKQANRNTPAKPKFDSMKFNMMSRIVEKQFNITQKEVVIKTQNVKRKFDKIKKDLPI